jgi:hypothetical protein
MISIQVRIAVLFIAAACGTATTSWRQQVTQQPSVAALLAKFHSTKDSERVEAFEQLRSNPVNLQSPEVRKALLDLLDRENHELDSQLLEAQKKVIRTKVTTKERLNTTAIFSAPSIRLLTGTIRDKTAFW